jgi:hypothetical protein
LAFLPPVLLTQSACIVLALFWAVVQFHREEVLFRESEGAGWRRRLRRLFPASSVPVAGRPPL